MAFTHETGVQFSARPPERVLRLCGPVWSGRCPVTAEIVGSNPIVAAMRKFWKNKAVSYTGEYPRVYWPQHLMSDSIGMLKVHRAVISEHLGRLLLPEEVVHHIDEDRNNWKLSNLELMSRSQHCEHHTISADLVKDVCPICGVAFTLARYRSVKYINNFCSSKCSGTFQEKICWPSDTDLSDLVWQQPLTKLAKQLGVSDKAVRKRCVKRGVPLPPRGYWSRKK